MEGAAGAVVREFYERANRGDIEGLLELVDPEVEWHWPPRMVETGVFHGREDFRRRFMEWRQAWEEFRFEPEELIERGDEVLSIVRYVGTGRGSGVPFDEEVAHVYQLRGGKVVRLRMFGTVEKARRRFLEAEAGREAPTE